MPLRRLGAALAGLLLPVAATAQRTSYPPAPRDSVTDTYFGRVVADPYRPLEALDSPATREWVASQNALTRGTLDSLPARPWFARRLTELWDYPQAELPERVAGRIFYRRNDGRQKQSVLYVREGLGGRDRVVLDPNRLSPDGSVALPQVSVSPDGRLVAYALAEGGSDLQSWRVREVATGRDLLDTLRHLKFTDASWTLDNRGFFYARFDEPVAGAELSGENRNHRVYYHALGTAQSGDRLIYEDPAHPTWLHWPEVTEDGCYLIIEYVGDAITRNRLYVKPLGDPGRPDLAAPVVKLIDRDDAEFIPLGTVGDTLYVRTDLDAETRRIAAITLPDTVRAHWRTIVPAGPAAIENARLAGGHLVVHRLADVRSRLELYGLDGRRERTLQLPGLGTIEELGARADTPELFYSFTSFLQPPGIYRVDLESRRAVPFAAPAPRLDPRHYETRQLFYASKDGTRVPMFVTARKGIALDGSHPTILYGYGGFAVSSTPFFSVSAAAWVQAGGVFAVANLRGGGEFGEAWHRAGKREHKQTVFDDFIAAAEYLVRRSYTAPERLAIRGGSNGGLLVGAVMTQRPELAGVALPAVGVMDMLRYQRFTGGHFWVDEYGSSDDSTAVGYLLKYSPLHNVRPGTCYPATLLTTADHDDRVVPSHTYKFTAALQAAQECDRPILVRIEAAGSHGYRPRDRQIAEAADVLAFTAAQLGLEAPARSAIP